MLDQSDLLIIEFNPLASVAVLNQTVVVTAAGRVPMVNNHRVKLVRVPPLNDWVV